MKRIWTPRRLRSETGATAVEYGLLLALVAGVIIGTVIAFGGDIAGLYASVPSF